MGLADESSKVCVAYTGTDCIPNGRKSTSFALLYYAQLLTLVACPCRSFTGRLFSVDMAWFDA